MALLANFDCGVFSPALVLKARFFLSDDKLLLFYKYLRLTYLRIPTSEIENQFSPFNRSQHSSTILNKSCQR
jgi:hypothetical protein